MTPGAKDRPYRGGKGFPWTTTRTTISCRLTCDALRFEPLADRPSKVRLADLGAAGTPNPSLDDWLDGLPDVLAAAGLKRLRDAIVRACERVVPSSPRSVGTSSRRAVRPYLIDWIERGVLNGLALNGSAAIHDLELAIAGKTSEDVGARLMAGTFGFARETSDLFAVACDRAAERSAGSARRSAR